MVSDNNLCTLLCIKVWKACGFGRIICANPSNPQPQGAMLFNPASVYCVALFRNENEVLLQWREWQGTKYLCLPADMIGPNEELHSGIRRIVSAAVPMPYFDSRPISVGSANIEWDRRPAILRLFVVTTRFGDVDPREGYVWFDIQRENPEPDCTFDLLLRSEPFLHLRGAA